MARLGPRARRSAGEVLRGRLSPGGSGSDDRVATRAIVLWLALTLVVVVALVAVLTASRPGTDEARKPSRGVIASPAELRSLPTSGRAWSELLGVASAPLGRVALADQNSLTAGHAVAAGLVYARTGRTRYRDAVLVVLRQVPTSSLASAKVLSISRQLAGYAIAADLVGYRDPAFVSFMSGIRTRFIGNHGRFTALTQTSDSTSGNWGAWATASRVAIDRYLGDTSDLAKAAQVFKGFTGDRGAHTFRKTTDFDPTWACDPESWQPINPAGCGDRSGAFVEDISRSRGHYPRITQAGVRYSWEVMSASMLTARMLARAGYPAVYQWGDRALLRAFRFLQEIGAYPPPYGTNQYTPYLVSQAYHLHLRGLAPAGTGRQFGSTDWLR